MKRFALAILLFFPSMAIAQPWASVLYNAGTRVPGGFQIFDLYGISATRVGNKARIGFSAPMVLTVPAVGTSSMMPALSLANTTTATALAQQYSPTGKLCGNGWSTSVPGSQLVCWKLQTATYAGFNAQGELRFTAEVNGIDSTSSLRLMDNGLFLTLFGAQSVGLGALDNLYFNGSVSEWVVQGTKVINDPDTSSLYPGTPIDLGTQAHPWLDVYTQQIMTGTDDLETTTIPNIHLWNRQNATALKPTQVTPAISLLGRKWNGASSIEQGMQAYVIPGSIAGYEATLRLELSQAGSAYQSDGWDIIASAITGGVLRSQNPQWEVGYSAGGSRIFGSVSNLALYATGSNSISISATGAVLNGGGVIKSADGFQAGDVIGSRPACVAGTEGTQYYVKAVSGSADGYWSACMATGAGVYAWKTFTAP
jgi:hypothetical protein